jgi:hypothetical protein
MIIERRQHKFGSGSEAAKVALVERLAAFCQKAELIWACFSVLLYSEFSHKRK